MFFFRKIKYNKIITQANLLKDQNKIPEALNKYEEAFNVLINVKDYFNYGCFCVDLEKYDRAIQVFNDILEHLEKSCDNTSVNELYYGIGFCYDNLRQNNLAIENFEKAIETGCMIPECYGTLGRIYDEMNLSKDDPLTQKALKYYLEAIKLNPDYLEIYVNLGTLYEKLDKKDESLKCFLKAYELDKTNSTNALYNLGVSYGSMNDLDKAEYYYLEELKTEKPYKYTLNNLALVYKDKKDYKNALKYYLLAIDKNKEDYDAWYNLGCLYAIINDFDNAFSCFTYIKYNKYDFLSTMENDCELIELRKDKRYLELIQR